MKVKVPIYGTAPAKATYVEQGATVGAQIGTNLLMPDGKVGTLAQLQALFGSGTTGDASTGGALNTTDDLDEGQWNLWFTDERAQDAVVVSGITDGDTDHSPSGDAVFEALAGKEPAITAGTIAQYRRGDKTWRDFATDVRGTVLTGLSLATSAVIAATDTVLQAFGKLQAQISGKAPITQSGTYADRPSAGSAQDLVYYATDVQEAYRSDGSAWLVLPTSGGELGYAQTTVISTTTSATPVDIAGLTVTCLVGEKPVYVTYGGAMRNRTAGQAAAMQLLANSTVESSIVAVPTGYLYVERSTRISGLTPGSLNTFKLQQWVSTSGTMDLYGDSSNPPFIRVSNT